MLDALPSLCRKLGFPEYGRDMYVAAASLYRTEGDGALSERISGDLSDIFGDRVSRGSVDARRTRHGRNPFYAEKLLSRVFRMIDLLEEDERLAAAGVVKRMFWSVLETKVLGRNR